MTTWNASGEYTKSQRGEMAHVRGVVLMAGCESERLFGGPDDCGKHDLRQARSFASACFKSESEIDDFVDFARRSARRLLRAHAGALISLTTALFVRRTLDAAEIARVIERAE